MSIELCSLLRIGLRRVRPLTIRVSIEQAKRGQGELLQGGVYGVKLFNRVYTTSITLNKTNNSSPT